MVNCQPEFSTHPQGVSITEGDNVTLSCNASGNPSFSWTVGGSPVNTTANPRITLSSNAKQLTITNVLRADSSEYKCVANNSVGTVLSNPATLDVQYAPEFTKKPENIVKIENQDVVLNCSAVGNPQPSVEWTKDDVALNITADPQLTTTSSGNTHSLTIQNVHRLYEGQYRCVANNSVGSTTSEAGTLTVHLPGAPPGDVQAEFASSTEISVTWDIVPENLQHGTILYYIVTYRRTEGGEQNAEHVNAPTRTVKLAGLAKYTYYSISVVAFTIKGGGPGSIPITVRTGEDKPSASPTLNSVMVLNSTSVRVEWDPVPVEFRNGIITKYTIVYEDEVKRTERKMVVQPSVQTATINGLRQKAVYSFWILAATSKGDGPPSNTKKETTNALPTVSPPADNDVSETEVTVKLVNRDTLSSGKPVSYYQMIVMSLTKGKDPGNPADTKYELIERTYEDQVDGEPYITAEFARDESRTTFIVGDGKYYSRPGITEAKRKRRALSTENKKYLNGKLNDNTEYAVFQRSFDTYGDYENEGFIRFKTKAKRPSAIIVSVAVVAPALLLLAVAVIFLHRRYRINDINLKDGPRQEIIQMSGNINPATETSYCNSIQLNEEPADPQPFLGNIRTPTEGQVTHDEVQ